MDVKLVLWLDAWLDDPWGHLMAFLSGLQSAVKSVEMRAVKLVEQ